MEPIRNYEKNILSSVDSFVQMLASEVHRYVEDFKLEMVGKTLKTFQFDQGSVNLKLEVTQDNRKKFFLLFKPNNGKTKRIDFSSAIKLALSKNGKSKLTFAEDLPSFDKGETAVSLQVKKIKRGNSKLNKRIKDAFNSISGATHIPTNPDGVSATSVPEEDSGKTDPNVKSESRPSSDSDEVSAEVQPYLGMNVKPEPRPSSDSDEVSAEVQPYLGMNTQLDIYLQEIKSNIDVWYSKIMNEYTTLLTNYGYDENKIKAMYDDFMKKIDAAYTDLSSYLNGTLNSEMGTQLTVALSAQKAEFCKWLSSMMSIDCVKIQQSLASVDSFLVDARKKIMDLYSIITSYYSDSGNSILSAFNSESGAAVITDEQYEILYSKIDSGELQEEYNSLTNEEQQEIEKYINDTIDDTIDEVNDTIDDIIDDFIRNAEKEYDSMTPEEKAELENKLNSIKEDFENAKKEYDSMTPEEKDEIKKEIENKLNSIRYSIENSKNDYDNMSSEEQDEIKREIEKKIDSMN